MTIEKEKCGLWLWMIRSWIILLFVISLIIFAIVDYGGKVADSFVERKLYQTYQQPICYKHQITKYKH